MLTELNIEATQKRHYAGVKARLSASSQKRTLTDAERADIIRNNETRLAQLRPVLPEGKPESDAAAFRASVIDDIKRTISELSKTIKDLQENTTPLRPPSMHPVAFIFKIVARYYHVNFQDMLSKRRTAELIRPRHVALYLAKELTLRSYPDIARRMGDRDHTTALHAIRKITRRRTIDCELNDEIEQLMAILQPKADVA